MKSNIEIIEMIKKFIDKESKFIPDIHADMLLDRLAKLIKEIENEQ